MKTTNYEISKKLKEIGFEAETNSYFYGQSLRNLAFPRHIADSNKESDIKSYDLETLINSLPKVILFKKEKYYYLMQLSGSSDCLLMGYVGGESNRRAIELEVWREENESLADTAGRLIINLFNAGIISK